MTIKIYMKDNFKTNYHEDLFQDYSTGLYQIINNVYAIQDMVLDYRFYNIDKYVLGSFDKEQFYFVCEN